MNSTSQVFKINPQTYFNRLGLEWLGRHWAIIVLPLVAVGLWGCFDSRALYVVLMLMFLVYPMCLTIVWFDYALSTSTAKTLATKQITFDAEGFSIEYLPSFEGDCRHLDSDRIIWKNLIDISASSQFVTIVLGPRIDERILIPLDSLDDEAKKYVFAEIDSRSVEILN